MMDGQFWILREPQHKANAIAHLANVEPSKDQPLAVKIEPYKKNRSKLQNAYLWGWVYKQIAKALEDRGEVIRTTDDREIPWTADLIHAVMKQKYGRRAAPITARSRYGELRTLEIEPTTANMNSAEFSEYVEKVKQFTVQFWGIAVPEPPLRHFANEYKKELGL